MLLFSTLIDAPERRSSIQSIRIQVCKTSQKGQRSEDRATLNITYMVVSSSFMYALGTTPFAVWYILLNYLSRDVLFIFKSISFSLLWLSMSIEIFFYYFFNKNYKEILNKKVKSIFSF